jgi:hypothetical protein
LRQRTAAFKATGEKAVTDKVNNNIKDINSISINPQKEPKNT